MKTFVNDKTGRAVHMPGEHDDLLFACFLALQGDLRCPRTIPYQTIRETNNSLDMGRSLSYSGAVDHDDDDFDDEDDAWNYTI